MRKFVFIFRKIEKTENGKCKIFFFIFQIIQKKMKNLRMKKKSSQKKGVFSQNCYLTIISNQWTQTFFHSQKIVKFKYFPFSGKSLEKRKDGKQKTTPKMEKKNPLYDAKFHFLWKNFLSFLENWTEKLVFMVS